VTASILTTKLYIPQLPSNIVSRPRLNEKLDKGIQRRLTLISAPAGYGKTTLLSDYVNQCGLPVAWLSLDEGDNDVKRFLIYVISALQTVEPDFGAGILSLLESPQSAPFETILTDLINEISKTLGQFILVLDDYHRIESGEIDQALLFILDHMPPQMRLMISSRTDPSLPLSSLRARGHLTEMREKDLRFTIEEARTFLESTMGIHISTENVDALEIRTEGWITGLQLAAVSMQELDDPEEISRFVDNFSSSHRFILDYLMDEVLQQRPEGTREFLLQTSILNRLNAPLCQTVTEVENSQDILESLEAANLFLIPLDNERYWYRYHHLFEDMLQKRLDLFQPEIVPELHLRAAGWYRQNGWIRLALDHLLAAGDYSGAADLVQQNARTLLERSQLATLMTWVEALPEAQVRERPWLCVYHTWALRLSGARFDIVESRLRESEASIENFAEIQKEKASSEDVASFEAVIEKLNWHISGLRAFQHLYKEEIHRVLELTQPTQFEDFEENFVLGAIAFARGWALRFSGDLKSAYQTFEDSKKFSLASGNVFLAVGGSCRSAYGHVLGGELQQAYDDFQEAADLAKVRDGKQYPVAGYAYVYMGTILYEWNILEKAKQYLLEGIELCAQVGFIFDQVTGLASLALVHKALGNWEAAQDALEKAEDLRQQMKYYLYVRRWVENVQVRLWRAQNAWDRIDHWIQTCGLKIDDVLDYNRDMEHTILARALVYSAVNQARGSEIRDALRLLSRLLELADSANWTGKAIEILVLQALAFQALGDERAALLHLEKALTYAEPEDYIRTFIDEGEAMHSLMRDFRTRLAGQTDTKARSIGGYVDSLLAEFEREKRDELPQYEVEGVIDESQAIVELLTAREQAVLRLMAEGATNQEIAVELVIALSTAKKHVSNIIGKLGVTNRTQAVSRARELKLL